MPRGGGRQTKPAPREIGRCEPTVFVRLAGRADLGSEDERRGVADLDQDPRKRLAVVDSHDPADDVTYSFGQTMDLYLNSWGNLFWTPDEPANGGEYDVPQLGDVRGKVVILQNYNPSDGVRGTWSGLHYRQANIQDDWDDPGFTQK